MSLPAVLSLPITARIIGRSDAYTRGLVANGILVPSASPKGIFRHSVEALVGRSVTAEQFAQAHVDNEPAQARQRRYYESHPDASAPC